MIYLIMAIMVLIPLSALIYAIMTDPIIWRK